ncbi:MAG: (d)CMP kinase [Alphaproteobacteria bacterium TMED194]|nr:MAG: (d)CMP kinase [Alphaproteobacteria bacterium TMED194]
MIEIAIDGTSASGKGTLAKKLSQKYAIPHLDTGLMYRKVASEILKNKIDYNNLSKLSCQIAKVSSFENLQNEELRTEKIAQMASKIAVFPALRNMLNLKQKEFIGKSNEQFGGCVLDGRDIGTKILPHANFKFFIDASIEIRAKRRLLEKNISFLHQNDEKCMLQTLKENMVERDNIDRSREDSPMVPAKDAYVIDTTSINADQLLSIATKLIEGNLYT